MREGGRGREIEVKNGRKTRDVRLTILPCYLEQVDYTASYPVWDVYLA